ncbi:MAG: AMP-binding protein [Opitutales bacterium]
MSSSLNSHLASKLFDSLRSTPFKEFISDYGLPLPKKLSRGMTLTLSLLFSAFLNQRLGAEKRVGVVLPAGFGGILSNLALFLSDRVPVNLNFTLGYHINAEIIQRTGLKAVITATPIMQKFPEFPWPRDCILVDQVLKDFIKKKFLIFITYAKVLFFPRWVRASFKIPRIGGSKTAVLLFTSGSSGKPKGVPLSHSNILANCEQMSALNLFEEDTKVLLNLPFFHCFGLCVGMIFSTLRGMVLVCTPSPLDSKLSLKAIREQKVEILLGTPTFLRGYLNLANEEDLLSVKYVVSGAEKSPPGFSTQWENKVACEYLEGYGLTETAPAISFNLPGNQKKEASVGRLLQGIECKTIDPENGKENNREEGGVLCFRGPNVFRGYWEDDVLSKKVLSSDGWFRTGDLGRLDQEGFLWIEGRASRFSKIGGEMVPHAKVEEEILALLNLPNEEQPKLVVCAVQDEQKGEKLVVLSTFDIKSKELKLKLRDKGIPNLWIPRVYVVVETIPTLGTGKIDWQSIRELSSELVANG